MALSEDRLFIDSIESTWKGNEDFAIWLVKRIKPKTIVDLGFDRGLSTIAFAYKSSGEVFGIDWFEEGNYAAKSLSFDSAFENISLAIRNNYAKNIHLIIAPFSHALKKWKKQIDILHIDWAHSYKIALQQCTGWSPFLKHNAIILMHDVLAYPEGTGRAFDELPLPKIILANGHGMGIATANIHLLEEIKRYFSTF